MTSVNASADNSSLASRLSLLSRLKAGDDTQGWQDFYRLYGPLIRNFARKAGLTEDEAEEVVQETAVSVARNLPGYTYDPKVCAFKTWLLNLTQWRVTDQIRKRRKVGGLFGGTPKRAGETPALPDEETARTATVEWVAYPAVTGFGAEWDAAYEQHLFARALEAVKERIDLKQFQIFDLYVLKGWPASEVAQALEINVARVYLAKHRVASVLKKEMAKLERSMG